METLKNWLAIGILGIFTLTILGMFVVTIIKAPIMLVIAIVIGAIIWAFRRIIEPAIE